MNMRIEAPPGFAETVSILPLALTPLLRENQITEGLVMVWGRQTTVVLKDASGFAATGGNAPWPEVAVDPGFSLQKALDAALWRLQRIREVHRTLRRSP